MIHIRNRNACSIYLLATAVGFIPAFICANAQQEKTNIVDVESGQVPLMTIVDDLELDLLNKVEILFFETGDVEFGKNCYLKEFNIEPINTIDTSLGKNRAAEFRGTIRFGDRGSNGRGFFGATIAVVPENYDGRAYKYLIFGKEYKIWSSKHNKYAIFKLPQEMKPKDVVRLAWFVDKGEEIKPQHDIELCHVEGSVSDSFSENCMECVVRYVNPKNGSVTIFPIVNNMFQMDVAEMGGELLIGPLEDERFQVVYIGSLEKANIKIPDDADKVFEKGNAKKYTVRLRNSTEIQAVECFVEQNDVVPVFWSSDVEKRMDDESSQDVKINICPGAYWVRMYRGTEADPVLVYETKIEFSKEVNIAVDIE